MATVKYIGIFAEGVDIQVDGRWQKVPHGGTLEVSDADAKSLCEQVDNWQAVAEKKSKADAPKSPGE